MALIMSDTDRVTLSGEHYIHTTFVIPLDHKNTTKNKPYHIDFDITLENWHVLVTLLKHRWRLLIILVYLHYFRQHSCFINSIISQVLIWNYCDSFKCKWDIIDFKVLSSKSWKLCPIKIERAWQYNGVN